MADVIIHWFRRDLRLEDNTAWSAALATSSEVLPVYFLDDRILEQPTIGAPRLRFLRTALRSLDAQLRQRGSALLVRRSGDVPRDLNRLVEESGAWSVYCNRDYTPYARARDQRATRGLQMTGIVTQTFADSLMVEPYATAGGDGNPALDFDTYRERWLDAVDVAAEAPRARGKLVAAAGQPPGIDGWQGPWAAEVAQDSTWPGATPVSARQRLRRFVAEDLRRGGGTTLSAALNHGTISARQVARALVAAGSDETVREAVEAVLDSLSRRDFAYQLAFTRPELLMPPPGEPPLAYEVWRTAATGDTVVDTSMRRLEEIGWLPHAERLRAAAFLVDSSGGNWRAGAAHYMRRLVDADVVLNAFGWREAAAAHALR